MVDVLSMRLRSWIEGECRRAPWRAWRGNGTAAFQGSLCKL